MTVTITILKRMVAHNCYNRVSWVPAVVVDVESEWLAQRSPETADWYQRVLLKFCSFTEAETWVWKSLRRPWRTNFLAGLMKVLASRPAAQERKAGLGSGSVRDKNCCPELKILSGAGKNT